MRAQQNVLVLLGAPVAHLPLPCESLFSEARLQRAPAAFVIVPAVTPFFDDRSSAAAAAVHPTAAAASTQRPAPPTKRGRSVSSHPRVDTTFLASSNDDNNNRVSRGERGRREATSSAASIGPVKVVSSPNGVPEVEPKEPSAGAYWAILRPHNIPFSFGLVAAGALVASHSVVSLLDRKVVLTALAAASVAVGSCVLNDWFDMDLDRVNKPDRPLVTGEVVPQHALGIGVGFLLAAVASAWAVHPVALQATIVASVALTMAYTPLLKPLPAVKNLVVAGIVAAAIAAGGLAAGAGVADTIAPSALTFFVIAHREILMDISDVEGDKIAGVRTLPVLLGCRPAFGLAILLLTAGVGAAVAGILSGTSESARPVAVALSALFACPLYLNVVGVGRSDFSSVKISSAVDQALGPLALLLGLMGIVLR